MAQTQQTNSVRTQGGRTIPPTVQDIYKSVHPKDKGAGQVSFPQANAHVHGDACVECKERGRQFGLRKR